jgi:DNA-binding response OmpR family regulator
MIRVAIIDDCAFFVQVLSYQFRIRQIDAKCFSSSRHFTESLEASLWEPDVFILDFDLGPSEINGSEACRLLREKYAKPVIILTGSDHLSRKERKMLSYDAGALQFLTKPHDINELVALIRNFSEIVNKSSPTTASGDIKDGGIDLYNHSRYFPFTRKIINSNKTQIELTEKEGALLEVLLENRNCIVDKAKAYAQIYGRAMHPLNRAVDNLACRLRTKLSTVCPDIIIDNQRAQGYRLYQAQPQTEHKGLSARQR